MNGKRVWPFEIISLCFICAASITGWLLFRSYSVPAGIVAGGMIGIINFKWLGSIVKGALSEGSAARYTIKYLLKFLFMVTVSALLIYSRQVDPLGFLAGFTITIITVSLQGTDSINRSE